MAASTFACTFAALDPLNVEGPWSTGLSVLALAGLAWLLTYALHSTVLLCAAWIATRRIPNSQSGLRERLWKFAVLGSFATASLQVGLGFEPLGGRLPLSRATSGLDFQAEAPPPSAIPAKPEQEFAVPAPWLELVIADVLAQVQQQPEPAANSLSAELARVPADQSAHADPASNAIPMDSATPGLGSLMTLNPTHSGSWTRWAFAVCVLGAGAGLLLFALLWFRLNGCLRDRVALEHGELADMLRVLCARAGIKRRVRLSVAPALGAPISMGLIRAEICVPPRVLLELSVEEREALLAHELAHVVRRDPLWLALCRLCEGVFFFQPLNRVARREIEDCAEFLSDAWAVRQTGLRVSLASCLTRIAEWIVGDRRALPAPAMAQGRSRLRHRVELLLDETGPEDVDRRPSWLGSACVGFGATLIAVLPCVSATEANHDRGDSGGLAFLPERDSGHAAKALDESESEPIDWPAPDEAESQILIMDALSAPTLSAFEELTLELDALALEALSLRTEVLALDLRGETGRELASELKLLEIKLARLRELAQRLLSLSRSAEANDASAQAPIHERDAVSLDTTTNHTTSTPPRTSEEITK